MLVSMLMLIPHYRTKFLRCYRKALWERNGGFRDRTRAAGVANLQALLASLQTMLSIIR
jgi:hypothetical protein